MAEADALAACRAAAMTELSGITDKVYLINGRDMSVYDFPQLTSDVTAHTETNRRAT